MQCQILCDFRMNMASTPPVAYSSDMADTPDPQELARWYLDLWQQHLTQAATDPDLAAGMANLAASLPNGLPAIWPGWPPTANDRATSNDTAPQRPATDAAAPDGGRDGVDKLVRRLESLEKRLDALEQKPAPKRKRAAKGSGKRKS